MIYLLARLTVGVFATMVAPSSVGGPVHEKMGDVPSSSHDMAIEMLHRFDNKMSSKPFNSISPTGEKAFVLSRL